MTDNYSISIDLTIVIPVLNEEKTVELALRYLFESLADCTFSYEVIVVESNSTDQSFSILQKLQQIHTFFLLQEEKPSGKGAAVIQGMAASRGRIISIFDADLEYKADDLLKLVEPLLNGTADLVLGSRHRKGESIRNFGRFSLRASTLNLAHKILTMNINFFYGADLTDPFTMYKVFRKSIFEDTRFICHGFDLDWEIVLRSLRQKVRVLEFPVSYNARSFQDGKKIKFLRDGISGLRAMFLFRFIDLKSNTIFGWSVERRKNESAN